MTTALAYDHKFHVNGVRSAFADNGNGLRMHYLEAGYDNPNAPHLLLLHGFPELAFSWRKVMAPLAAKGFHVIAPDQRGYGMTTGWDDRYDGDVGSFRLLNLLRDVLGLLTALRIQTVEAVVGHDFGASVAAYCALLRPDVFQRMVLMSAPFSGAPALTTNSTPSPSGVYAVHDALGALPIPRKHYHWYYATSDANTDMVKIGRAHV